jgi:hypothetical protein
LIENSFDKPSGCSNIPTFHHYNDNDNSQIDYVLQSAPLIDKYLTFIRHPLNTSTHDPVMVTFSCNISAECLIKDAFISPAKIVSAALLYYTFISHNSSSIS